MRVYTVVQTFTAAVELEVEADSEEEALDKADDLVTSGAISDEQILESLQNGEMYVEE